MKLAKKTYRSYLIVVACLFPIACVLIYFVLRSVLASEIDEQLQHNQLRYKQLLKEGKTLVSIQPILEIKEVKAPTRFDDKFKDVVIYETYEKENDPYRELVSVVEANGKWYELTARQSVVEFEDLLFSIMLGLVLILSILMSTLFLINRYLFQRILSPFEETLHKLRAFEVMQIEPIQLEKSNIDEFSELNEVLLQLTSKVQTDYSALKEFTENASHEIQTPLAIISMNLEELLQEENISTEGQKQLLAAYSSAQRLSKLNEKLLLLTKIDNAQFNSKRRVNFNELTDQLIENYAQLDPTQAELIQVTNEGPFTLEIDSTLAHILLSNLLSNAFKHGKKGGDITISLTDTHFFISNEITETVDTSLIFHRFQKKSTRKDSIGLGLAIAKKISDKFSLGLKANSQDDHITFSLEKKK